MANKTHTDLSPSNAARWLHCPGSVALCKTVPKLPQSPYASEGEAAHELLEKCLRNPKINPFDLVGDLAKNGVEWDEEMAESISFTLNIIRAELQKGGELLIEQRLTVIPGIVEGTLDVAVIREFDSITVFDFKYGKGVVVPAADNPQLLLYVLPLSKKFDVPVMRLVIVQPRTEGQVSSWECTSDYLDGFEQEVYRKIELSKEKDALFLAGTWCKWCQAKIVCQEVRQDISASLPAIPEKDLVFPNVKGLSPATVKKVLDYKDRIEDWLGAVAVYAQEYVEAGGTIEGYELGKKRANRRWINEVDALKEFSDLGEKAYKVALLSPAQMEKIAGKERVSKLTEVPDNGMTLKRIGEKK